ncbi:pyridoxamine 5'-phosphate oxidase family protein [Prescottella equi]
MVNENIVKLHDLLASVSTVMLTTIDDQYRLVARPMAFRVGEDLSRQGVVNLFAPVTSRTVSHIAARAMVSISATLNGRSISLSGTADFTTNREAVESAWHPRLDPWFPCRAAGVALIEVTIHEARWWTEGAHAQASAAR